MTQLTHDDAQKREAVVRSTVDGIPDGWCGGTQPVYLYRLSRNLCGTGEIVEIGTFAGKSATALAMGQKDAGGRPIHTIDRAEHPKVRLNLEHAGISNWVRRLTGASHDLVTTWTLPIELLFIDGGHVYEQVRRDIDLWSPFVVEGGLVALHDYPGWDSLESGAPPQDGIHRSVRDTFMNQPRKWRVVSDREFGSIIVFRRINPPPRYIDNA